jgi:hypothetical protein
VENERDFLKHKRAKEKWEKAMLSREKLDLIGIQKTRQK